jgi:hypothetical protein
MSSYVPAALRRLVVDRAHGLCEYCLIHEDDTFIGCQVEHIVSEKHGGMTNEENLAYACVFCNRFKGSDIASISASTGQLCRLFNPRSDEWARVFRLDGATILPKTDVGEVTVQLLGMNHPERLLEREILRRVNRYPSPAAAMKLSALGA